MIFLAPSLIVKPSSIIELCIKWSRDSGSMVIVLSPKNNFLSSVSIYGKPVSYWVAQLCGSINLSLPLSFAEISKGFL